MLPSRAAAAAAGEQFYFTGKPCQNNHIAKRYTNDRQCVVCKAEANKQRRVSNKDSIKERNKKYYTNNKDHILNYQKQYRANNKDHYKEYKKQYDAHNKSHLKKYYKQYYVNNKDYFYARSRIRQAAQREAYPAWVDRAAIAAIYAEAIARNKLSPGAWHVDHIIPLQHPAVCGLHVPWNLRIIPAEDNLRKRNKLIIKE